MNSTNERSIAASKLSQPLKWHSNGGKHYLAPKLIELFPPHVHYVEPYFGGGSVLLSKSGEGVSEVANDIHGELSNFWHVLKNESTFAAFQRIVEATPFSEVQFKLSADDRTESPPVWRAWAFFVRARQSRQGLMKDFATLSRNRTRRGMNEQVSSWLTAIEGLPEVHARLKRVVILNRPALEVIKQQDGVNSFFYLDPPYLHETRVTTSDYQHEMTREDHQSLLDVLTGIEGKFMLSGYPSPMYDNMARIYNWRYVDFDLPNNASSKKEKERKIERVWMNY
jgi:DNA adenine methylase